MVFYNCLSSEVKDKQCSKTLEKFLRNVKDMLVRLKENTGTEESKMEKADESKSESEDDEEQTVSIFYILFNAWLKV